MVTDARWSDIRTIRDFGTLIRSRRGELGWSQGDLAARSGVSRKWVNEIEAGKATAELGRILKVVETLGLRLRSEPIASPDATGRTPDDGDAVVLDEHLQRYRR